MRNTFLYNKLVAQFGSVQVAHEGAEDEEYRVCCPFCRDGKHRLYINCKWGVLDPTGSLNKHLVHCYNESCVQPDVNDPKSYEERMLHRDELMNRVYYGMNGMADLGPVVVEKLAADTPVSWPGKVIRLDKLARKNPEHPAVVYMQGRGFDPIQLGEEYGFVFCDTVEDPKCGMALGTILMPIWRNGELYSWISRYIGDSVNGMSLSKAKIKKYYNMPGRSLAAIGYNLEQVLCYSTIVIVEGILDAIRTGPFATCLFTKTVPATLKKRILKGLQKHKHPVIVIMLDPDQSDAEKNKTHHIEQTANAFLGAGVDIKLVKVYLPSGKDPGSMSTGEIHKAIRKAAKEQHVHIDFTKHFDSVEVDISDPVARTSTARTGLVSNAAKRRRNPNGKDARQPEGESDSCDRRAGQKSDTVSDRKNPVRRPRPVHTDVQEQHGQSQDASGPRVARRRGRRTDLQLPKESVRSDSTSDAKTRSRAERRNVGQ